jgi:hypothetical protein
MSVAFTIDEWANESIVIDLDELFSVLLCTVYLQTPFFPIIVDEWHVLLKRYRLMESSHGELGSNSHVILDHKQVALHATFDLSDAHCSSTAIAHLERLLDQQREDQ